jgi:hypothetical protein
MFGIGGGPVEQLWGEANYNTFMICSHQALRDIG